MAQGDGATVGRATAKIGLDSSGMVAQAKVAAQSAKGISVAYREAFKAVRGEQRAALEQARQTTVVLRSQQVQVTAAARAASSERMAAARAEASVRSQQARAAASATIEAERRITADHRSEIRAREAAARAARPGRPGFDISGVGGELAGAFGVSLGVAGAVQMGRMTAQLAVTSAQAERTRLSFDALARGVGESGDTMLASMRRASRGMIADTDLILAANKAVLLGVAENSTEMAQLLDASRVLSQAAGLDVKRGFNDLVVGLGRLSPLILDNLLIANEGEAMFENYARSVGRSADSLTKAEKKQILLNQVMEAAAPLLEAEAGRAGTAADEYDRLGAAWKNYTDSLGGGVNTVTESTGLVEGASVALETQAGILQTAVTWWNRYATAVGAAGAAQEQKLRERGFNMGGADLRNAPGAGVPAWMTGVPAAASGPLGPAVDIEARDKAKFDWARSVTDLNERTHDEIVDQERDFGRQRARAVADYQKSVARESADFTRQQANQERELALSILDIHQDSARQRVKLEQDLARTIAQARVDSAERVTDARGDANERLVELEQDYQKNRERAAEEHLDTLMDAAGRLDAVAVREAQRNFKRQEEDAKDAYDEQRDDLNEKLRERIDEEAKALAKSIAQQQEAHAQQLADQAENDRLRIADMKASFEAQKAQDDLERGIRLARQAEDHNARLTEMGRQHSERIAQIIGHAQEERAELDFQHKEEMVGLKVRNDAWLAEVKRVEEERKKIYDRVWGTSTSGSRAQLPPGSGLGEDALPPGFARGGLVPRDMIAQVHRGEYVLPKRTVDALAMPRHAEGSVRSMMPSSMLSAAFMPAPVSVGAATGGNSRSITVGDIHPTIILGDVGNRSDADIKDLVIQGMLEFFEDA